jgi:leader peptidase (prepilin peptidase)/N-methyltransferase
VRVEWVAQAFIFVLGLLIGSFLNVVIVRLPRNESVVRPRSRCPKCRHAIAWYENLPVLSWLALRGKCRVCRQPISLRYPAIELLTGILFWACAKQFSFDWTLVHALTLIVLLVPLSFIDLEHWILPFELTLPGIVLGPLLAIAWGADSVIDSAVGVAVGFFSFWALEWVGQKIFKKEALGQGDKYLLALLGGFLGWRSLLGVIFLSSFQASIVGITLLLLRGRAGPAPRKNVPPPTDEEDDWVPGPTNLPLGPWLSLAGIEVMLLGPVLAPLLPYPLGAVFGVGQT